MRVILVAAVLMATLAVTPNALMAAMGSTILPPLHIVSPANGATVAGTVIVVFETSAELSKMTMGGEMSGMSSMKETHLHIDLDRRVMMPAMKQITKISARRYSIDLGKVGKGLHTIRMYWADSEKHKPIGAVQVIKVTVK